MAVVMHGTSMSAAGLSQFPWHGIGADWMSQGAIEMREFCVIILSLQESRQEGLQTNCYLSYRSQSCGLIYIYILYGFKTDDECTSPSVS